MASAPTERAGWTRSPALEYSGGRIQCFAVETTSAFEPATYVRCTFSTRELAGPASCPRGLPFSADYIAEMRPRDEYMRTRAMATLASCFPDVTPTPYQAELAPFTSHTGQAHPRRVVSGRQYAPPGQAPVRLVTSTEMEERNGGRCIYQAAEFQIGLKPSAP